MNIIRKKAKFGKGLQEFYIERYQNYQEFLNKILERQPTAHKTIQKVLDEHNASWVGVSKVDDAINMLLNGWEKPLEDLKVSIDENLAKLEKENKRTYYNDVSGFVPIVPNALKGLPNSMINMRNEKRKGKILKFEIVIDRASSADTDTIIKKMSKQLAQIAYLERTGKYRCRVEVVFAPFSDYLDTYKIACVCSVLVKSENQMLDVKRLCYPIIHPSMLRLMMFSWYESLPLDYWKTYYNGYGKSVEWWGESYQKDLENALNENNETIIMTNFHSDIEKKLKEYM